MEYLLGWRSTPTSGNFTAHGRTDVREVHEIALPWLIRVHPRLGNLVNHQVTLNDDSASFHTGPHCELIEPTDEIWPAGTVYVTTGPAQLTSL